MIDSAGRVDVEVRFECIPPAVPNCFATFLLDEKALTEDEGAGGSCLCFYCYCELMLQLIRADSEVFIAFEDGILTGSPEVGALVDDVTCEVSNRL